MRCGAVPDQYSWSSARSQLGKGIEYVLNPVEADLRVGISGTGAGKMPSRSRVCGPCNSMCHGGPYYERLLRPSVVWFYEKYSDTMMKHLEDCMDADPIEKIHAE